MQISKKIKLAQWISEICIPPLFLIFVVTIFLISSPGTITDKLLWWFILFIVPACLPIIYIIYLFRKGKVSNKHLPIRSERTRPYIAAILCILLAIFLLKSAHAPAILILLMTAYLVNAFFLLLINFTWKVSAHAVGVACPLVVLSWSFGLIILPLFLILPVVAWARWQLGAHTFGEVLMGSLAGLGLTILQLQYGAILLG